MCIHHYRLPVQLFIRLAGKKKNGDQKQESHEKD
jgi:hypothetical protein